MDKTVPLAAARLLDYIGSKEAPSGYDTLYGNAQKRYSWRLTQLPISKVLALGPGWSKAHGSSACGRYQFMAGKDHTLQGLYNELRLNPDQIFDANLQDRLGYHLLRRRGYDKWVRGELSDELFMVNLAKEWASLPVPIKVKGHKRDVSPGESYYAGVGDNKSLDTLAGYQAAVKSAALVKAAPPPVNDVVVAKVPEPTIDLSSVNKQDAPAPLIEQFFRWVFGGFKRIA